MINKTLLLMLFTCLLMACKPTVKSSEILFVCTHGAARSPIAAAYFNKLAKAEKMPYHAVFRGTKPDATLTKETVAGLTKDGFDITDWKPQKVSAEDVERAHKVVTFDCSVPADKPAAQKQEWNGTPSISKDYDAARTVIKKHVENLVAQLKEEDHALHLLHEVVKP